MRPGGPRRSCNTQGRPSGPAYFSAHRAGLAPAEVLANPDVAHQAGISPVAAVVPLPAAGEDVRHRIDLARDIVRRARDANAGPACLRAHEDAPLVMSWTW